MQTIKLEVGKTYRSRGGKEVKIVGFDKRYVWPYYGSDGRCYADSGQWSGMESPYDLIEEVAISDANQKHNKMKTLQLEVGNTYRSRKGTDVRIITKVFGEESIYGGDNGNWYTENGRFKNDGLETIHDLIEEAPKTSLTFDIPNGAKKVTVSQQGNRIIVEMVPEKEPKPGDIVFEDGRIMIVKKSPNRYHAMIHGNPDYLYINGSYGMPFTSATFRLATAEEAQLLFDALKKAGKRWNIETMQVEDVPEVDVAERERIMDFLRSYLNNVTWSHEQLCKLVESYLKHKEGKK